MTKQTKRVLLLGAIGGVAAGGLFLYWRHMHPALASGTWKALPASKAAGTNVVQLTLSPGNLSTVPLDSSKSDALSLFAPTGGTLGGDSVTPATGVLASSASGEHYEYVAAGPGSATITIGWTDAAGKAQTSVIPVTVT